MHSHISSLKRICLLGLDPTSASIALALKRSGFRGVSYGVGDATAVKYAWGQGFINDGGADAKRGIENSDLVILSCSCPSPRDRLVDTLDQVGPSCIILECSTVKGHETIVFESSSRKDVHYVGFHVVQESTDERASNPSAFFFENKAIILTPRIRADYPAYKLLAAALESSGATVIAMSPQAFHERLAILDFVPDLLDFAELEQALTSNSEEKITAKYLGLRMKERLDRLASLHQSSWHDALAGTRESVERQLTDIEQRIHLIRNDLRAGSLRTRIAALLLKAEYLQEQVVPDSDLELVVVTGGDAKLMERISKALAAAHVNIQKLEQLKGATNGAYKLRMLDAESCTRAASALKAAGIETELLH